jgi:site-specific recombinase
MGNMMFGAFIPMIINLILIVGVLGLGIVSFVLFVKLALRGIKALDIYISLNRNKV